MNDSQGLVGSILGIGARLPPPAKVRLTERLLGRLSRNAAPLDVETNLGLRSSLRWRIPARQTNLAFGLPRNHLAERATLDLASSLSGMADGFLDVGSNYGLFAVCVRCANPDPRYQVIAIEPDPDLAARLSDNVRRSSLSMSVLPVAASNASGKAAFLRNLSDDSSGSLTRHFAKSHETREIVVDTVPLADVISRLRLERLLVKIDVEGAGTQAWEGLAPAFGRVRFLVMEVIGPEAESRLPERIVDETGWSSYYIEDYLLKEMRWSEYRYIPPFWNWLFCREGPWELQRVLPRRFKVVAR